MGLSVDREEQKDSPKRERLVVVLLCHDHGASALPGIVVRHAAARSASPLGMRRGSVPRPERHGAHRTGGEVSRGVRLEPFLRRSCHFITGDFSSLSRCQSGVLCRAWDQPRALGDEQHIHDHLL